MIGTGALLTISLLSLPFSPVFTMSIFSVVVIVTPRDDVVAVVVVVVLIVVVASTELPEIGKR